jgi:hypothetical protein
MSTTAKKPAGTKPAKIKEGVDDIVLLWFKDNNRPATTQGVVDALGSRIAKPACQKALDNLVEQSSLLVKEVKKAKYYYLDQSKLGSTVDDSVSKQDDTLTGTIDGDSAMSEEAAQMQALRATFVQLSKEQQVAASNLARLQSRRTRQDAQGVIAHLQEELLAAQKRLTSLSSTTEVAIDWPLLKQQYTHFRSLWRQRKQICEQIIDAVSGDGPRDVVVDESGITIDSAVGVSYEDSAVNTKKRGR